MIRLLLVFLMLMPTVWAGQRELDLERANAASNGRLPLFLTEEQQLLERGWRDRREGEWQPVTRFRRPSDYIDLFARGTVEYAPTKWRNYSFHKVLIADGTTINGGNFTQNEPFAEAIVRKPGFGHNLTFIEVNLSNVFIHDDWTLVDCQTMQSWMMEEDDPETATGKREERRPVGRFEDLSRKPNVPSRAVLRKDFD